ncbi:MAG: hypothetical protein GC192_05815 [Bacteroidetes bacterium]|nr:hypothetical protein [Bacteroidota bacterium]
MVKAHFAFFFFLFLVKIGHTQSLNGEWSGEITQDGKPNSFHYSLSLTQEGDKVFGTATSSNADGSGAAKFKVGGQLEGTMLVLQEVLQLEPENARWCLKHMRLQFADNQGVATLEGNWEAQGCKPGFMKLELAVGNQGSGNPSKSQYPNTPVHGRYAGNLSQSDRDYGFYFEMEFNKDGTGTSHIVSDGEGGNATHRLHWTFDETAQRLDFEETEIIEESVPSWRWCMKSGSLFYQKESFRRSLTGAWSGFIEGHTLQDGPCAPGKLFVEQAILEQNVPAKSIDSPVAKPIEIGQYEKKTQRNVDVERVMEVRNKTVRIRVWDNGTVDGDVLSLFLNGDLILKNYRVTRQKYETIVKLDKPTNFIILHCLSVGSISPNTVAVSVDDGFQEQVVIISSNLKNSGAIMLREFTVK